MSARDEKAIALLVEQQLGSSVMCSQCQATLETYDTACTAQLDQRCPGFEALEQAIDQAREAYAASDLDFSEAAALRDLGWKA